MIGSKEFIEYADKANIPMSYRVWAYALWRAAQKTAHNSDYTKCLEELSIELYENRPDAIYSREEIINLARKHIT